jgi:TetR/AcrR family transcriptional repressor of bet genes
VGRPSNTETRRAEIVEGLRVVLAREGYERATIAAVAKEAGLAPGLVHYHFASKLEILVALVVRLAAGLEARTGERLVSAGDDPRRRLLAYVDAHVSKGADEDPAAVAAWVAIAAEATRVPEVRAVYQGAIDARLRTLEELARACLRADGRDARSARSYAAAIASAIEGAFLLGTAAPGSLPEGFAAPTLRRLVAGLLGPDGPR